MPDGPSQEELDAGCPFINAYCEERHDGKVACSWLPEKGRILTSCRAFRQGEVIFREPPLHIVAEQKDDEGFKRLQALRAEHPAAFEYEPLWYWTALCSLTKSQLPASAKGMRSISEDQQKKLLLLYHSEVTEAGAAAKLLVEKLGLGPKCQALDLERLLQVWILNCFEHSDEPLGYSTYFMSSFMSHSCFPNAVWHYEGDEFVLRARADIADEEEICVSYLSEDSLLESVASRRKHLKDSKHFVCSCVRCTAAQDFSRGFKCPACAGEVFFCPRSSDGKAGGELAGQACAKCARPVAANEAERLLQEERWLEAKLDGCERRMERNAKSRSLLESLQEAVARGEESLAQHWLLDKSWQMLADLSDRCDQHQEAEGFARKRMAFQERAYRGLSGTQAWTLEAYADMLIRHWNGKVEPSVKVPDADAAQDLAAEAPKVYEASLRILCHMFGEKHEYSTVVQRKLAELRREIKRHSG